MKSTQALKITSKKACVLRKCESYINVTKVV